jgi:DNA-binding response OmpR family regulator
MSVIANNETSRLLSALVPSASRALQQESLPAIRNLDPIDMPELCGVTRVFVLVAGSVDNQGVDLPEIAEIHPPPAFTNLLCGFERAPMPADDRYRDSDAMIGEVKVNFATMEARRRGEPIFLTALEFKTLKFLIANARRVISRDELLNEVWGYHNYPTTRTVDNQVAKLRKKLETDPARPVHLRTVHGVGYKFLP